MKCSCVKGQCVVNSKCRTHFLRCTELCESSGDDVLCKNNESEDEIRLSDSDDEF